MISSGDQQEKSNVFLVFRGKNSGKKVVDALIYRKD